MFFHKVAQHSKHDQTGDPKGWQVIA